MYASPYIRGQFQLDGLTDFSGTATGSVQQLLPQQIGRSVFYFQNNGAASMFVYVGPPPATATISGGAVTGVTVADNGSNWLVAPQVLVLGGIYAGNYNIAPGSPNSVGGGSFAGRPAKITVSLSGSALSSFAVSDPGAGYLVAPTIILLNPWPQGGGGAGTPSATAGFTVVTNGSLSFEHSFCPNSAINLLGTSTQAFVCKVGLT